MVANVTSVQVICNLRLWLCAKVYLIGILYIFSSRTTL